MLYTIYFMKLREKAKAAGWDVPDDDKIAALHWQGYWGLMANYEKGENKTKPTSPRHKKF